MSKCVKFLGIFLMLAFFVSACSDDKDEVENEDLIGKYEYKNFQFAFEYTGDNISISIPEGISSMLPGSGIELPEIISFPASEITTLVNGLGKKYIPRHFKNIQFKNNNEFSLAFSTADIDNMSINGTYKTTTTAVDLNINKQILQQLTGLEDLDISTVKFNYTLNGDQLTLVLNWANIEPLLKNFITTDGFNDLIKDILSDYPIPEILMGTVITYIKSEIEGIFNKVKKLEGTFVLTKITE